MNWLFGNLNWDVTPFTEAIANPSINTLVAAGAAGMAVLGAVLLLGLMTYFRLWGWLWREWLTSTDHKKIGVMYIVLALVMLARGVAEGVVMRGHQALAFGGGPLSPEHFGELFSTHGTIMIFFVAMPMVTGMINILVPLQIGARDMAFPVMNQVSLGLTAAGAILIMASLVVGQFETGGWTAYPPFTGKVFSPGVGPDYWVWSLVPAGLGSMLSGINFAVTIYKCRAPGMTYMRMPLFTWTALCTSIMLVYAMPPLTICSLMQALDRYLDFHFFTNDLGGNMMNYANIFWMFGHPEVYILVLPAYGIWSEVSATFSAKRLYGYTSLVVATMAIAVIAFAVWLHHFYTMGQSASVNIAFGIATMVIALPTGVKVYDWMATLWRGRIRMTTPVIYLFGFFILFVIGGLSGVILANPTVDFQLHNTMFLVAHFHNVLIPGVLFGMLAGIHYWFPKVYGFRLDETWGRRAAWLWIVGFTLTFMPLYVVGLMGKPRRSASFTNPDFVAWEVLASIGALIILAGFISLVICYALSFRNRDRLAVPLGDPWDGRTLEWATPSPVPEWNFAVIPQIRDRDAFAVEKAEGKPYVRPAAYEDIAMPRPTAMGAVICATATAGSFALVWHITWLAWASLAAVILTMIRRSFVSDTEFIIPASEVEAEHEAWLSEIDGTTGINRDGEMTPNNRGLAAPDREVVL